MGVRYLGPIDGHDLPLVISTLEFAKTCDHPIVIHVLTKKGKGFEAALKNPEKFHGLGPYDVSTGATLPAKPGAPPNWQDVFGQTMVKLCQKDSTIVGITAAMPSGTSLKLLEKAMPNRYYDVGIAEEHAVLFAAAWPPWASTRSALSTRPSCNAPTTALFTMPLYRICPSFSAWTAPDFLRKTARLTTGCLILPTFVPCPTAL